MPRGIIEFLKLSPTETVFISLVYTNFVLFFLCIMDQCLNTLIELENSIFQYAILLNVTVTIPAIFGIALETSSGS